MIKYAAHAFIITLKMLNKNMISMINSTVDVCMHNASMNHKRIYSAKKQYSRHACSCKCRMWAQNYIVHMLTSTVHIIISINSHACKHAGMDWWTHTTLFRASMHKHMQQLNMNIWLHTKIWSTLSKAPNRWETERLHDTQDRGNFWKGCSRTRMQANVTHIQDQAHAQCWSENKKLHWVAEQIRNRSNSP